jgi:oxygen-independent coproporphyrinogen-3 oxidase
MRTGASFPSKSIRAPRAGNIADAGPTGIQPPESSIQDFDAEVQKAVNRIQSQADTLNTIEQARAHGFVRSVWT